MSFIVYALPRSRTAWLSAFLTYGEWTCGHDVVADIHTIKDLKDYFSRPYIGSAETAMVDGWQLMKQFFPNMKVAVIKRPLLHVAESLKNFGIENDDELLRRGLEIEEVSKQEGVLSLWYEELDTEEGCKKIFEHCLGIPFDREWWLCLRNANIQIDMSKRLAKLAANKDAIANLKAEVAC